jgi:hypothetical protein
LEVRALEWRRFGFGIADSFQAFSQNAGPALPGRPRNGFSLGSLSALRFYPAAEIGQRCPPRIALACFASTELGIPIPSTARAKSLAVLLAERSRGQGEQHLLAQYVLNRKTASFIVPDFGIGGRDGVFRAVYVDTGGAENEVEVFIEAMGHRIKAAGAGHFEVALVGGPQTDVVNLVVGPAMLGKEVGAAAHRHAVQLPDAGAVIDDAGRNGFAEFKRLPFQIEHGNQYGHGILTVTG